MFEIVVAEALDRVSRDQADVATLYKHLRFAGVMIVTLSEGEINELHVGLKGTMNALFLKDLAAKTHRGLRGRVEQGRSGGGICYGYDVVKSFDGSGDPVRGGRTVNETEAEVVRRVFREFASGASPRAIARRLNGEGISGPSGKLWTDSTIRGHAKRGTGLINNELYIGRLVWNRLRYVKNPETGKRVSRINPPEDWIVAEVPELRIVDDAQWKAVKDRQGEITEQNATILEATQTARANRLNGAHRPRHLLSGLLECGVCGGPYLKGISTGDFGEALAALLGSSAPGLSASTITRLKEVWGVEAERWQRRDLTAKRYVYFWVDGIYFSARMEEEKQCILVIVGATDKGQKELIAIADGYRESEQSWLEVLLDLKRRGLEMGPQLALGDGALGFWKALRQVYPGAREQRCWVHKTGNVLNKLPKGLQKKAKGRLQDIWMAETRKDAESAFDFFLEAYGPKYDKAAACLAKDRDVLLTFYDFPAEHWKHVRTTNPIESTFATVRLRTYRTKGCLSRKTAMAMVFKLCQCAQRKWRKLDGSNHLAEIIRGVKFVDGERQDRAAA